MIAWLLSKLFTAEILAEAINHKPKVISVSIFTEYELEDMEREWIESGLAQPTVGEKHAIH